MLIGYMRVSSSDERQSVALQRDALLAAGVDERHLHQDRASGARDDRPGLKACLGELREGDVLVVWKIDRLGRSLSHLIRIVEDLKERGVAFRSLTEAIDTTNSARRVSVQPVRLACRIRESADHRAGQCRPGGGSPTWPYVRETSNDRCGKGRAGSSCFEAGASKASVRRTFKVARSTLIDTLKRTGWTGPRQDRHARNRSLTSDRG